MDAVCIENLSKSFREVEALDGVSLRVETGTVCGFVGPNGAGKTTTIRILLGLLQRDRGTVRVLGEDVAFGRESGVKDRLAYLPQDPVFPERHTGAEVLELVAGLYRMNKDTARERAEMLFYEFHLDQAKRRSVGTYSKGMKQRLGLAACFLPNPELMILDEPVSALDPEGRAEVFDILRKLKGKSTVLFSSHILEDVERISDTLVMIKNGRKVLDGPMEEILTKFAPDRIRVRLIQEDVSRAISELTGLSWVERVSAEEEAGLVHANVRPAMMDQAIEETIVHLIRRGLRVIEYGRVRPDLETLFLRLSLDHDHPHTPGTNTAGDEPGILTSPTPRPNTWAR